MSDGWGTHAFQYLRIIYKLQLPSLQSSKSDSMKSETPVSPLAPMPRSERGFARFEAFYAQGWLTFIFQTH